MWVIISSILGRRRPTNLPRARNRGPCLRLRVVVQEVRWAPGAPIQSGCVPPSTRCCTAASRATQVRDDIWTSWRRSASSGLSPEQFTVPHTGDGDRDGLLVRAARPVLELVDRRLGIDECRTCCSRAATATSSTDGYRSVRSARGSIESISHRDSSTRSRPSGRTRIGTAIAARQPSFVRGSEHFADALTALACAAAPIMDPRTGHVLGVIDLTCSTRDASPLMLALARRAAREIEERLVDDSAIAERVMMRAVPAQAPRFEASDGVRQPTHRSDEHRGRRTRAGRRRAAVASQRRRDDGDCLRRTRSKSF